MVLNWIQWLVETEKNIYSPRNYACETARCIDTIDPLTCIADKSETDVIYDLGS